MRLWVLAFVEKHAEQVTSLEFIKQFLKDQSIEEISVLSGSTILFKSKDIQNARYWEKLAKEMLDSRVYFSILELKSSDSKPVGPMFIDDKVLFTTGSISLQNKN